MITEREGMRLFVDIVRREKRQRQRRQAVGNFFKAFAGLLLKVVLNSLMAGLWFMLAVGVIHHEWIPALPTIGYWWAVLVAYLLRVALTRAQPPSETKPKGGTDA